MRNVTCFRAGQQAAVGAGAPAAIVESVRNLAGDAKVSDAGCCALRNIALLRAGMRAIDATGWRFPPFAI